MKRYFCAALALLILMLSITSCASENTVDAERSVGTVGDMEVSYDELYFLANNYLPSLSHLDETEKRAELDRLIRENITVNFAILALCEDLGIEYDERDYDDAIDEKLEALLYNSFGGDKDAYEKSLEDNGLTERYLRYTTGIDLLYENLLTVYPQRGLVTSNDSELIAAIKEEFIHVYHLALFNDSGDDKAENLNKLTEAREALISGEKSVYDLIKAGYTEDFSDPSGKGYYIVRGTMEDAYEDAAFSLNIGEVSEVIESMGENNKGEYVSCYYLISRFEIDEEYVKTNLTSLQKEYYGSVIASDMEEVKQTLAFAPNEFYDSLDLTDLLPPEERSNIGTIVLCVALGIVLIGGTVVAIVLIKRRHSAKNLTAPKISEKTERRK